MKGRYVIPLYALLIFGAAGLAKKHVHNKLAPLRSHSKTIEYVVQKNDKFKKLADKWIPNEIRQKYDYHAPYLYLMGLNKRTSSYLQIGEKLIKPVYK